MPSLVNIQMELRKACNHPYLIKGVEEADTGVKANGERRTAEQVLSVVLRTFFRLLL